MKVAVFTDNDFDKINGVTTTLTAVLQYAPPDLSPRIYTAAALGADQPDYLALRSFGVGIPFYREMKMYVPHWRQYLERVKDDGVDVIHLTTPGPLGLVALWVAAHASLPLVGSFHTDLSAYTRLLSGSDRLGNLMQQYMRWMYGHCRRVLVPSESTRQLLEAAKCPADRIRIWSRGVDTQLFAPDRRCQRLRDDWRVTDDQPALLYVGRLSKEKGLALLPPLQAVLRARGLNHRLIIAGDGPMRRQLADECPGAVITGPLGREDVARVFASADLLVFPSETDTAGNVVLEAQASGLPVVVSGIGGPKEQMRPGVTGIVCDGRDPATWADAVATLLPAHRRGTEALDAREYALSRRWDVALAPLFEAYRELGDRRAPRAA
jgi:glycosyltransferase involved in cell wall biosynthesis